MVKIAVIGCGLMGTKVAGELAYHGHRVKLYDSNLSALNNAHTRIEEDKRTLKLEGILAQNNFIGQILCMSRLDETVNDAELIIEAVIDDLEVKKEIFEKISHLCRPDAIISSNSLRCDLSKVVEKTQNPQRTVGLRFLYPVYYIPEVEITPHKLTSQEVIERIRIILERMGKTLFFRSGGEPLILTEEQREERKKARLEQVKNTSGLGTALQYAIPALSHRGNMQPSADDEDFEYISPLAENDCAICMDEKRNCLLCPCHHMVTCSTCAELLLNRADCCPICRKEITEVIKVYHS